MDHNDVHEQLSKANELLEAGKAEETLVCLERIEQMVVDPEDRLELNSMKAWALSDLGRHDDALDLLEPLVDEHPDSARLQGTLGVVLSNAGELEPACAALEEAVRLDEEDESAVANLALVYERMRQYERSLELYERAIELGADIDWLLQRKAAVHAELGDYVAAKASLKRYLSLAPDDVNEWTNLAILYSDDDEFEQAFQCYREAEQIAPDSGGLRLNWGVTAVRAGQMPIALQQLRYLERLEPDSARMHLLRAFVMEEQKLLDAALREYDTAIEKVKTSDYHDLSYALEMAMDFASRQGLKDRCESLFTAAYAANCCTVELCEAYRDINGEPVESATWFSIMVEADYRPGLSEVPDRDQRPGTKFTRYLRNVQIVAVDRDDALSIVTTLLERMGERGATIREFVGEESMENACVGVYEIERDSIVYGDEE